MKRKMLIVLLLVATLLTKVTGLQAAPAAMVDANQTLETIRKKYDLPALAVAVTLNGTICDRGAVGRRKRWNDTPVTTNDVFHIGSCTKSMTATLAAMLIEEGKLRWDTTIGEVFPEWQGTMDKQYESVTVEQLMHHRGGVPEDPPSDAWKKAWKEEGTPVEQRTEFIKAVLSQPPAAPPGTQEIYSNQGYTILGAMLEKITGTPWETLITERLFKPLHMDSAGFGPPGTIGAVDEPWGHTTRFFVTLPVQLDNPTAIGPAGRVHCSLDDLARFTMLHLQTGPVTNLLKPETLKRLHTPVHGAEYGCGWVVLKRKWAHGTALFHNGSNSMWYVVMWLAPERKFSVVVGTNIDTDDAEIGCDDAAVAMMKKWLPGK